MWHTLIFYNAECCKHHFSAVMSILTTITGQEHTVLGFPAATVGAGLHSHLLVWATMVIGFVSVRWLLCLYYSSPLHKTDLSIYLFVQVYVNV